MTRDEFWDIIEEAKRSARRTSNLPSWLEERLSQSPEQEILDFGCHFQEYRRTAYDARLWLAAVAILGGCGDDSFDYFRGWLVAQGRAVFEAALTDPDSLADLETFDGDEGYPRLEPMLSVDSSAYCRRIGGDRYDFEALQRYEALRPRRTPPVLKNPELLHTADHDVARLFPKLAARFPGGMRVAKLK